MNKLAKIVRIITIPTLLFFATLFIMFYTNRDCFPTAAELWVPICFIGCFPLLAYALAFVLKLCKKVEGDKYRKTQRTFAFIFSVIGYAVAFVLSLTLKLNRVITILTSSYFFSVIFLSCFNLCKLKASGHACGITGPILFLCYFVNLIYIIPCVIVFALSFWSSLYLKRHTVTQLVFGALSAVIAFILALLLFRAGSTI